MTDFISQWEAEEQRRHGALGVRKAAILAALNAAGIALAVISYDGEGDSGQIESIRATDATGQACPDRLDTKVSPGKSLRDDLDGFAWELLDECHCGFYNEGGGSGGIFIDAAKGSVTIDHTDRFVTYENTVTEV
jgi:hypothetical protein